MGRHRKPTIQLRREGNFRDDRQGGRADVAYEPADLKAPHGLGTDGQWLWALVIKGTPRGILSAVDTAQLFGMCKWWARWRKFDRRVDMDVTDMRQMAVCWKQFSFIAGQFGLSPAARTRIKAPGKQDAPDDPLAKMIAGRVS